QISMGAIFFDYDDDNDPDLYLTHDNNQPNILYENQGDGTFLNVAAATGCDYAGFGMGVDVGDLNNDGSLDLYITNLYENTLYLNLGGSFYNISANAETDDRGMGWGTSLLDYNNDGLLDIYAANDSYFSPDPNVLYRNDGNNQFTIVSEGQAEGSLLGSYGTATLDFNNDGRLDLVVANTGTNDACSYLENQHDNDNSWLKVRLVGTQSNRDAVGARVVMLTNEGSMTEEVVAGSGYGSQNSQWLHFGMGSSLWVNQMDVRWPSGQTETFYDLGLNEAITIVEGQGIVNTKQTAAAPQWQIAPNPVRGQLSLLHTNDLNVQAIRMVDAHGRVVLWQTTDGQPTVAVGALPAGVYYLGLLLDSGWEQQRVVVTL
ncbi:MAG: FG-GAP-like repeat-containing protein, partial [Bacteroidota bacterium]